MTEQLGDRVRVIGEVEADDEAFYEAVAEALESDEPCELEGHGDNEMIHNGPGIWFAELKCPKCDYVGGELKLICDRFKVMAEILGSKGGLPCTNCNEQVPLNDMLRIRGRKNG